MTKDEALKLALEALESFAPHNGVFWRNLHKEDAEIANVIASLRQAIEQAEKQKSKPVCWDGDEKCPNRQACCDAEECLYTTLFAAQPEKGLLGNVEYIPCCTDQTCTKCKPTQPEQEPVAWRWETHNGYAYSEQHYEGEDGQPLYTTPPQRQWVGLTDEERNYIWDVVGNSDAHGDVDGWSGRDVMAALEAKLKEKNT